MTIAERAKTIPDEAKTNHLIQDDVWDGHFTGEDIENAYVAGANDVVKLIMNTIFRSKILEESPDATLEKIEKILSEI